MITLAALQYLTLAIIFLLHYYPLYYIYFQRCLSYLYLYYIFITHGTHVTDIMQPRGADVV